VLFLHLLARIFQIGTTALEKNRLFGFALAAFSLLDGTFVLPSTWCTVPGAVRFHYRNCAARDLRLGWRFNNSLLAFSSLGHQAAFAGLP
jgi:hypothetical protein